MDPKQRLEATELKQVQALTELFYRLQKELTLLGQCDQAVAMMESNKVLDQLEALDTPVDGDPIPDLIEKRGKVVQALRWSVYDCTSKLKQWVEVAKEAQAEMENEEE